MLVKHPNNFLSRQLLEVRECAQGRHWRALARLILQWEILVALRACVQSTTGGPVRGLEGEVQEVLEGCFGAEVEADATGAGSR